MIIPFALLILIAAGVWAVFRTRSHDTLRAIQAPGTTHADSITAFGKCPNCGRDVRGGLVKWDGVDADGQPVSGVDYKAECEPCELPLFSKDQPDLKTRTVHWQAIESQDSSKTIEGAAE